MEGDLWSIEALRDVNSLAASIALKNDFNGDGAVVSYLFDKEKNHEAFDNSTGNSLHSHKHVSTGASPRTGWVRIGRGSFSGFVRGSGGFYKRSPHVEERWPRSASA